MLFSPMDRPFPLAGVMAGCLLFGLTASLAAEEAVPAEAAKSAFVPIGDEDLAAARSELAQSVVAVERLVGATTPGGAAWLEFLRWDGLQPQIMPDAAIDTDAAQATLFRLRSGAPGLEKPPMQRLGDAIEDYVSVARFTRFDEERQRKAFESAVDRLGAWLPDRDRLLSKEGSYKTEQALALVAAFGRSHRNDATLDDLAEAVRKPNAYVAVSSSLLNRAVARPVNDCGPLRECILGTSIRGTGATSGYLTVTPLNSHGSARLLFSLSGSTRSNTTGVNGPVAIRSVGNTTFSATKLVELNERSFRTVSANATARTRSRTTGVSKIGGGLGSRLIENIARKRVAQSRGQADAIASRKAADRVAARLDQQLNDQIAEARGRYNTSLVAPLERRRAIPRDGHVSTDSSGLRLQTVLADDAQLAAWDAPPAPLPTPLSVRVHQTGVNNLLQDILGGVTFWRDAPDEPAQANITTPDWLDLNFPPFGADEFKPWKLRLRDERPVSVEFGEGDVTITVHAAEFRPDVRVHEDWEIVSRYEPSRVDGRWMLVRQGDFVVIADGDPASRRERAQRYVLAGKLSDPESGVDRVIDIHEIDLSKRPGPIRRMVLAGLELSAGWATAGWEAN